MTCKNNWPTMAPKRVAVRLAAMRQRWQATRRAARDVRRLAVARAMAEAVESGGLKRGFQARLSRTLRVSEVTISRDVKAVLRSARPPG
jgi:hypothetical protein